MLQGDAFVPTGPSQKSPFELLYNLSGPCFQENEINEWVSLGSGSQGQVSRVDIDLFGYCAVKKFIPNGRFGSFLDEQINYQRGLRQNRTNRQDRMAKDGSRELAYTQEVAHHPNIVSFYGFLIREVADGGLRRWLYSGLITEYMAGGTIAQMITDEPTYLIEGRVVSYSLDITRALVVCHIKYNIMHRDIKPSNVLLTGDRKVAKLADFGYARKDDSDFKTNFKGSIQYMAPEMIDEQNPQNTVKYKFKPDVWSHAMFVYAMSFRRDPFNDTELTLTQLHRKGLEEGKRPSTTEWPVDIWNREYKEGILEVITSGWQTMPSQRRDMIETVRKLREMADKYSQ